MTAKQWLLVTAVVILNVIIFGALLGTPSVERPSPPTPTWTPHPTFTPMPHPTATAILMPTLPPEPGVAPTVLPRPIVHVVAEGETLESIAEAYEVSVFVLKMINRLPEDGQVRVGQELMVPSAE